MMEIIIKDHGFFSIQALQIPSIKLLTPRVKHSFRQDLQDHQDLLDLILLYPVHPVDPVRKWKFMPLSFLFD